MTLIQLIVLALQGSVIATVFSIGLGAAPGDLVSLFRRPSLLGRSLVSMFVVMLAGAVFVVRAVHLSPPVQIVVVALALAPVPPLLPQRQTKAGGESSFIFGLVVAASLFAIVWIPVALAIISHVFGVALRAHLPQIVAIVGIMIVGPLGAGVFVAHLAPAVAAKIQTPLSRLAGLTLLVVAGLILIKAWRPMLALIGNGTLMALAGFVLIGLVSGQLLGGPKPQDRSVLAIASGCRHPGITLSLATLNFPAEKSVPAVVLLYLVVSAILTLPYVAWRRRGGHVPS